MLPTMKYKIRGRDAVIKDRIPEESKSYKI